MNKGIPSARINCDRRKVLSPSGEAPECRMTIQSPCTNLEARAIKTGQAEGRRRPYTTEQRADRCRPARLFMKAVLRGVGNGPAGGGAAEMLAAPRRRYIAGAVIASFSHSALASADEVSIIDILPSLSLIIIIQPVAGVAMPIILVATAPSAIIEPI